MHGLWTRWVVGNTVGEVIGLGAAVLVGIAASPAIGGGGGPLLTIAFAALLIALGTFEGVSVGWAQWWAMRDRLPEIERRAWIGATALGAFVAWWLGMIPSTLISLTADASAAAAPEMSDALVYTLAAAMGLVLGSILGFPQWLVLRRHVGRAWWWIVANALAWMAGMPVVFVGAGAIPEGATGAAIILPVLVTLGVAGAIVGAVHGAFLVWLVATKRQLVTA